MPETTDFSKLEKVLIMCIQTIQKSEERIDRVNSMIEKLSSSAYQQTETFVMQIEKLSKRLDEAQADRQNLIRLNNDQSKQIDKLLELLHDSITKSTNFIQQQ